MTTDHECAATFARQARALAVVLWVSLLAVTATGQCPVSNPDDDLPPPLPTVISSTRSGEPRIPESGYLANTSYSSTYFGFVIDLPIEVSGHRIMLPLMPPGQHALLAIGFQEGHRSGTFLITASEPPNPLHEMTEDERKAEFQAWSKGEPSREIRPPDSLTRTGHWYHVSQHKGDVTTVQYWTFIKNYLIRVKASSNDAGFLHKSKEAVGGVRFYCAQEDGTLIDEQGKIVPTQGEGYRGPTIPTSIVDTALEEKPALELLQRGELGKSTYRNDELGVMVEYPITWNAGHDDPAPPAEGAIAQRTHDALDACSLLLLRLTPAAESAGSNGQSILLRAVDQACLDLPAPASATDRVGADELAAYLQVLGVLGEMRSTKLVAHDDQLFAEYSGVTGEHSPGEPLAARRVQAAAVTRHRKTLLVWTWNAGSQAELLAMPSISLTLEGGAAIRLAPDNIAKP